MGACTPDCGDTLIETGEECDLGANDGVAGSGCSALCQLTGDFIPETEPNDTQALANPLGTHAGFIAAIMPAGDIDYFSFTVPGPSSSVTIQTSDGVGGCPAGFDSILRLYDPAGVQIATDDNGGVSPCSLISPATQPQVAGLAAGTYRARVDFSGDNGTTPQYVVTIAVQ
jgi:cysteine-rich repeat protein